MIGKLIRLSLWTLCAVVASIVYRIAFANPGLVELIYSRVIYPGLSRFWASITGIFSFSVAEVLLYLFALAVLFFLVFIVSAFFKPSGKKVYYFIKRMLAFIITLCTLYTLFVFNWGLNYARPPLAETMGIATKDATAAELESVCKKLAKKANALRDSVCEDKNGCFLLSSSKETVLETVSDVYETNTPDWMHFGAKVKVKPVFTPNLLSSVETTGVFSPFTFEANINMQMPDLFFASTAAHEYAHLQGFAREDEANFIAWYVCQNSQDADFAYSGVMLAFTYAMNALNQASPEGYQAIYQSLHPGILRDWKQNTEYWEPFHTDFSENANQVYHDYLVSNGATEGKKSYGRMIDLIIAIDRLGKL